MFAFKRRLWRGFWLCAAIIASACTLTNTSENTSGDTVLSGAPVVQIISPLPNATFLAGVAVNVQATVSNAGSNIDRVEIAVDGAIVATFPAPNPSGAVSFSIPTLPWPFTAVGEHSISVTAFRPDGTTSTPVTVKINVIAQVDSQNNQTTPSVTPDTSAQSQPTQSTQLQPTAQPTAQTQPVVPPTERPTDPPTAQPTPSKPIARVNAGVNVRSGPSTAFNPPIGSLAANAEVEVLGINPAGDWYKIRYYNAEGWVYGPNVTISGNTAGIPVDAGPPLPQPTAVPPTPVPPPPASAVNFTIDAARTSISPHPFTCGQDSLIKVTVVNTGTAASTEGGEILVQDILVSSGQVLEQTKGAFPALQPGQSFTAEMFLRVNTNYLVEHRTVITIDSSNQVVESNESDNQNISTYVLQKGNCP